jgi:hypothetical protein
VELLLAGEDPRRILEDWEEPLQAFSDLAQPHRLYR